MVSKSHVWWALRAPWKITNLGLRERDEQYQKIWWLRPATGKTPRAWKSQPRVNRCQFSVLFVIRAEELWSPHRTFNIAIRRLEDLSLEHSTWITSYCGTHKNGWQPLEGARDMTRKHVPRRIPGLACWGPPPHDRRWTPMNGARRWTPSNRRWKFDNGQYQLHRFLCVNHRGYQDSSASSDICQDKLQTCRGRASWEILCALELSSRSTAA